MRSLKREIRVATLLAFTLTTACGSNVSSLRSEGPDDANISGEATAEDDAFHIIGPVVPPESGANQSFVKIISTSKSGAESSCTGTAITKRHILTAIHCVPNAAAVRIEYATFANRLRVTHVARVITVYLSPRITIPNVAEDGLAILKLEADRGDLVPVKFSDIEPVRNDLFTLYGYSPNVHSRSDYFSSPHPEYDNANQSLRTGTVRVKPDAVNGEAVFMSKESTEEQVFSGRQGFSLAMPGDSGGPALVDQKLIGVTVSLNKNPISTARRLPTYQNSFINTCHDAMRAFIKEYSPGTNIEHACAFPLRVTTIPPNAAMAGALYRIRGSVSGASGARAAEEIMERNRKIDLDSVTLASRGGGDATPADCPVGCDNREKLYKNDKATFQATARSCIGDVGCAVFKEWRRDPDGVGDSLGGGGSTISGGTPCPCAEGAASTTCTLSYQSIWDNYKSKNKTDDFGPTSALCAAVYVMEAAPGTGGTPPPKKK